MIAKQFDEDARSVHKLVESAENNNQHFDQLIAANNKSAIRN